MAKRENSRRSVSPKLGVRLPRLPSQQRRARKTPTLTAKGTTKAVAPEGRRVRGEAPRRRMTPRNTGSRRTGTTPQPNFPATDTRGPAPSTVKPTPTSWNADDSHRTFRPMRRRHHSAWASPSLRKHTSASGAQSRVSAAAYAKGWGRALLGLTFDLPNVTAAAG